MNIVKARKVRNVQWVAFIVRSPEQTSLSWMPYTQKHALALLTRSSAVYPSHQQLSPSHSVHVAPDGPPRLPPAVHVQHQGSSATPLQSFARCAPAGASAPREVPVHTHGETCPRGGWPWGVPGHALEALAHKCRVHCLSADVLVGVVGIPLRQVAELILRSRPGAQRAS